MEIRYFNSNFDKITQNKDTDQSITNLIEKLPSLNIVSDKNLLEETIKISNQFKAVSYTHLTLPTILRV